MCDICNRVFMNDICQAVFMHNISSHLKLLFRSFAFMLDICGTDFMPHNLYFLGQRYPIHLNHYNIITNKF